MFKFIEKKILGWADSKDRKWGTVLPGEEEEKPKVEVIKDPETGEKKGVRVKVRAKKPQKDVNWTEKIIILLFIFGLLIGVLFVVELEKSKPEPEAPEKAEEGPEEFEGYNPFEGRY